MANRIHGWKTNNVRIGPISIITLIIVICMAVLAVLSISTAHATMSISERQAEATKELYLNECAGQELIASIDDVLSDVRASGGNSSDGCKAIEATLDEISDNAREAADGQIEVTAEMDGTSVKAELTASKMRQLSIVVTILDDATLRIDKWKAAAVQQEPQSAGNLWMGA